MQEDKVAVTTDLVLVGGGHSHLIVLRHFAMKPMPGVRLTLVTREMQTPYSGMLPGYIAGHYDYDDAHIDLRPLAGFAEARIIHDEVSAIDVDQKQISMAGRPALDYDLLSINIGSRPTTAYIHQAGVEQFSIKPVDGFIQAWRQLEQRLINNDEVINLAIIGGGAGGVELALSLQYRAMQLRGGAGRLEVNLVTDRSTLLPSHNPKLQQLFQTLLAQRSIGVSFDSHIDAFDGEQLQGTMPAPIAADVAIWVTHASAAAWLNETGLSLDDNGFIAVNDCLQSVSHADIFAAGDIAAVKQYPRPKSGVFAVRQGIPLAQNLRRHINGQALKPFKPQSQFLSLISTGDRFAVGNRGAWVFQGKWCWWLKDKIDRNFVRRFSEFPVMESPLADTATAELTPMHCGGCGSKVGSAVLEQVLQQISSGASADIASGLQIEDAASIKLPSGKQLIQSVDHFRSFIDDPYLFGRIAANHALGDLFAMGVDAHSAMVIASVVYGSESKQAQDLYQLMSGVAETLQRHGTALIGGHSSEANEMSCGLSVNGFAKPQQLMLKAGMQADELLILTKPIGSGILFAADMRGKARGRWVDRAIAQMLVSSRDAAFCLRKYGASACTDVTGFGFAGHLFEMTRASDCAAEIYLDRLPLYDGVVGLAKLGIESSLLAQNIRIRHAISDPDGLASHPHYALLFDPQTAGGLLASVAAEKAEPCLQALSKLGYSDAQIVGRAIDKFSAEQNLRLLKD